MKRKLIIVPLMLLMIFLVAGCGKEEKETPIPKDATKFAEEYESLNGKENSNGKKYREVTIGEDNPFVYKSPEQIIKAIDAKESFVVYFGYNSCPWCRSVIGNLLQASKDLDLNMIYYVDIHDIRDTMELNSKNEAETSKKGSDGYYKLLEAFDSVLEDYTLTTQKGKTVKTGEKRIYAPNIISVIDGIPQKITTGISKKQDDAYMELTTEMNEESYNFITDVIKEVAEKDTACGSGNTGC